MYLKHKWVQSVSMYGWYGLTFLPIHFIENIEDYNTVYVHIKKP